LRRHRGPLFLFDCGGVSRLNRFHDLSRGRRIRTTSVSLNQNRTLSHQRFNPRNLPSRSAHLLHISQLPGRRLEPKVEQRLMRLFQLPLQLFICSCAEFNRLWGRH